MKTRKLSETAAVAEPVGGTGSPPTYAVANVPAWMSHQAPQLPEVPITGDGTPYVGVASPKSQHWAACQAAGCREGDLYLMLDGGVYRTHPLEFLLIAAEKWFTKSDPAGKVIAATQDEETAGRAGCEEHYTSILLIRQGDRLIASRSDFRGTKSGCVVGAIRAVQQAAAPTWGESSEAHKVASVFPHPWGRVIHSASTTQRTSKTSGNRYFAGKVSSRPAQVDEIRMLGEALNNGDLLRDLEAAKASQESRIMEFRSHLVR